MKEFFMETDRIGFGKWTEDDHELATKLWTDEDVTRYARDGGPFTNEEIEDLLARDIRNDKEHKVQYWPIFNKETGEFMGCCGLKPTDNKNAMEIRFYLFREFWGQGYASEAARRVISYAFDHLNIKKIIARHHPDNKSSAKCLNGLGFERIEDEYDPVSGLDCPLYKMIKGYNL